MASFCLCFQVNALSIALSQHARCGIGSPSIAKQQRPLGVDMLVSCQKCKDVGIESHDSRNRCSLFSINSLTKNMRITSKRTSGKSTANSSPFARTGDLQPLQVTKPS